MDKQSDEKEDLNSKFGVFGYMGRIPVNHFNSISSDDDVYREWVIADYIGGDTTEALDSVRHLNSWHSMPVKDFIKLGPDTIEEFEEENSYDEEDDDY